MDRVKELLAAGVPLPDAVKMALKEKDVSVTGFADAHGLGRSVTSEQLNLVRIVRRDFVEALAVELGGEADAWAVLFWEQAKPALAAA